jgi:hypothetical protein
MKNMKIHEEHEDKRLSFMIFKPFMSFMSAF